MNDATPANHRAALASGVAHLDLDGRVEGATAAFAALCDRSQRELAGQELVALVAPGPARDRLREQLDRARAGDATTESTAELVHPTGHLVPVAWRFELLRDGADRPSGLVAVATHVVGEAPALTLADQQARDARLQLRVVLDATPDWIVAKDRDHRLLFVNRAFAESQGTTPDALVGRLAPHDDDAAAIEGRVFHNPMDTVRAADGTTRTFDTLRVPMRDASGRVYGSLAYSRDVTKRCAIEEQLRASEARYRVLVDHAPVAVYVHDGKTMLFANPAMAKLLGAANPAEVVGNPLSRILHPEEQEVVQQRIAQLMVREANPMFRGRIVRFDGQVVHVDVMATQCRFEGSRAIQVVLVDVTEKVRIAGERARLEVELQQAQRLEAIGTLAAGVAHDFNNLLVAIGGNTALAERQVGAGHPARVSLREIGRATQRAADLVRQILTFSRPSPATGTVVSLQPVIEEVIGLLRASIPTGIVLTTMFEPDVPTVRAEPTQLHQVLVNLHTNAWQAIEGGVGRIDVHLTAVTVDEHGPRLHPDLHPGRYARISVTDTGRGIAPEILTRMFEPFFTTKPVGQGTGLGLSVVHGIMKSHGAVILASSHTGVGTSFDLYFPAAVDAEASAPAT